jgi:hypothetical protein
VFLAGGQSNMSGYSGDLSGVEAPSDLVHLFGNDARWARATEPMDGTVDQTDDVSLDPLAQHSPMLRFAKDLSAGIGVPVAIIPGPKGWSDLVTDWARRSDDPTSRGSLYGSLISRGLRQGYSYPLRGLIWFQGERDSVDSGRGFEIYLAALRDFVDDLRIDLAAPDLYFGNFQLATWNAPFLPSWMGVQEAQRVQAQTDSATVVVATVDQPRADCCHLTSAAYREVGRRLAQAMLARLYGRPAVPGPLLQTARFPSLARDRVQLGWDKSVTRREATLFNVTDASGNIPIVLVTGSGALIELHLQRPASGETKVTYGLSSDPLASWTIASDGSGAALAMQNVVVTGP